jgi:hypothetical protein
MSLDPSAPFPPGTNCVIFLSFRRTGNVRLPTLRLVYVRNMYSRTLALPPTHSRPYSAKRVRDTPNAPLSHSPGVSPRRLVSSYESTTSSQQSKGYSFVTYEAFKRTDLYLAWQAIRHRLIHSNRLRAERILEDRETLEVTAALTGHVSRVVIATQRSGREQRAVRESPPVW